jgi:hypothetical protein
MSEDIRPMPDLELALLRRGVDELAASSQACGRCRRRPLIGERVYAHPRLGVICELCRLELGARSEGQASGESRIVRGPEFGHTIRLVDRRAAVRAARRSAVRAPQPTHGGAGA